MHFLYTTPQQGAVVITNLKTKSSTSLIFEPTLDMFKFHFPLYRHVHSYKEPATLNT